MTQAVQQHCRCPGGVQLICRSTSWTSESSWHSEWARETDIIESSRVRYQGQGSLLDLALKSSGRGRVWSNTRWRSGSISRREKKKGSFGLNRAKKQSYQESSHLNWDVKGEMERSGEVHSPRIINMSILTDKIMFFTFRQQIVFTLSRYRKTLPPPAALFMWMRIKHLFFNVCSIIDHFILLLQNSVVSQHSNECHLAKQ